MCVSVLFVCMYYLCVRYIDIDPDQFRMDGRDSTLQEAIGQNEWILDLRLMGTSTLINE